MTDLINRLRKHVFYGDARLFNMKKHSPLAMEAAHTIEVMQQRVKVLRKALEESVALNENYYAVEERNGYEFTEAPAVIEMGRAALEARGLEIREKNDD